MDDQSAAVDGGSSGFVIVANRLPVRRVGSDEEPGWAISPGGLVTAMHPLLREGGGSWVGWGGVTDEVIEPFEYDGISIRPVLLTEEERAEYYNGFANCSLWPLYHDAIRTPEFHRHWWRMYMRVNQRFAREAATVAAPNATIWVHDYHLQLVPRMVREMRHDVRIGFFLHTPFPGGGLFSRLPWRRQLLEGTLGADLVGFQTRYDATNFRVACERFTDVVRDGSTVLVGDRRVEIDSFPISIDVDRFESIAATDEVSTFTEKLRDDLGRDHRVILGVDRLDYTKGINVRLRAIEALLERAGETGLPPFTFVQIAVPSRGTVDDYASMREEIELLVGRINGRHAEPGRAVIHYLHRGLPQQDLVSYYRAADVMLVTPLQDGMNLVAKEYVASRTDGDGVLVLSEFAGAASELTDALLVNPFDIDGVTSVIARALRLEPDERRARMEALRRVVRGNTVFDWGDRFMARLRPSHLPQAEVRHVGPAASAAGAEGEPGAPALP